MVRLLTTVQVQESPLLTGLTIQRKATRVETAGLRWICIGQS
jgi:hypothetical protein